MKCKLAWTHLHFKPGGYAPCYRFKLYDGHKFGNVPSMPDVNSSEWLRIREQLRNDEGAAEEVTWYEIDATTHGSVAVYSSQEQYEQYKSKLEEYRKDATDEIGAQIVHEFQGLVKASI